MSKPRRIALSWSSGKDSAWSLYSLRRDPSVEVAGLITTFNAAANRVAMHAVRRDLVRAQAVLARLPVWEVELPWPCANEHYEALMAEQWRRLIDLDIEEIAFGDLFLSEIREYRERQLASTGLKPRFPLWGIPTDRLAREMIAGGVRAKLTCVDPAKLDRSLAGREFDEELLGDLPAHVDPCGENGEFHTFVWDAPVFARALEIQSGEVVERDGFVFADVLTASKNRDPRASP